MSTLLEAIFASLRASEQLCVKRKDRHTGAWHQGLLDSVAEVTRWASQYRDHCDLYFGVAPRERGAIDAVSRVTVAWADLDLKEFKDEAALWEAIALYPAAPSFVIWSGHGAHAYWLLAAEVAGPVAQEGLRTLCARLGADATHHPGWVLRLPDTYNYKDPEHVVPVETRTAAPELRYALADLVRLCAVPERACHLIATGALKAPRDRKGHRSRSERDFDVLRELTVAGVSEDAIRTIFASRAVGDKYRADGEHYLEHSLQNAANAFSAPRAPFVAVNDQWFVHSGRARKQVSTFVFEPRRLLLDHAGHEDDAFLGTVRAAGQSWDDVVLPKGAFASAQAFLRYLPSMYWQWLGQDAETRQLCLYLMAQLEEAGAPQARATTVVGRHGAHFVTKTATLGVERLYAYEEAPVVYINRGARRAAVDTTPGLYLDLPPEEPYRALVAAISADLPRSNTPAAVANFVGWFCACSIKPLLAAGGVRFPHLNVFGTKGAGKSASILRLYLPLLGLERPASWTPNTTNFVIRSLFSATNAVPVSFTEFRAATVEASHNDFLRTLLMAYDVGRDSRGRADLTTETFNLDAPVVVDGEDAIADPAMRERTIYVNLHPEDVEEEGACYAAFQRLTALPLRSFAGRFYQHTLRETPASVLARFERALEETHARLTVRLVDRMRRNVAVVLVGLELYNEFVRAWGGTELAWDARALAEVVDRQRFLLSDGRTRSLVDDFIEDVVAFVANETIGHLPFLHAYDVGSNVLWFHLLSALRWWHKDLRQRGMAGLEAPAMRAQLGERARAGYVLPETPIATTGGELPCFGIPLERAAAAGLSVPARLDARLCVVRSALI